MKLYSTFINEIAIVKAKPIFGHAVMLLWLSVKLKFKNLPLIMVFLRKFLYGGRQKNYFHVKILILVCPNRFENR